MDKALLRSPSGIAFNGDASVIYVADTGNHRIIMIKDGSVTTLAGKLSGFDEDGDPLGGYGAGTVDDAQFNLPKGLELVGDTLVIADSGNNMVRAITASGRVVTVAGSSEPGDIGGHPLQARFTHPSGVAYHGGRLYIADTTNNKVKVMPFDIDLYK